MKLTEEEVLDHRRQAFTDRRDRRIANATNLAASSRAEAAAQERRSRELIQPILVGHHSEAGHRRTLDKSWNALGKSVMASRKASYYEDKLATIEDNQAIYSDDPDAIAKLKDKLAAAEQMQAFMKAGNTIVRNKKKSMDTKIEELRGAGHNPAILEPDCCGIVGYPCFTLSNNNANIRRMRLRLKLLEGQLQAAMEYKSNDTRYEDLDLTVTFNRIDNRFQLFFDSKPRDSVRRILKSSGFRWAPSSGAWQRHLGNLGTHYADSLADQLRRAD